MIWLRIRLKHSEYVSSLDFQNSIGDTGSDKTRRLYLMKVRTSVNFASRLMIFRELPYIMIPNHNA
jgi:hypothetical protein